MKKRGALFIYNHRLKASCWYPELPIIKIAFVIDTIESPTAGTERQLLKLIQHIDRKKFDPYLCVLKTSYWLSNNFNLCPLININISSFKTPRAAVRVYCFAHFLRKATINVVHAYFADSNKVAYLATLIARKPKFVSSRRNQNYCRNAKERFFLRLINRRVAAFVANCQSTAEWVGRVEGIARPRIHVIYNGIDFSEFDYDRLNMRSRYRKEFCIPLEAALVGIVANLRPVKAIDLFLRAAKEIQAIYPKTYFLIMGEGRERDYLQRLSCALGIAHRVVFAGARSDAPCILASLDVAVLCSRSESLSNALIEYLAADLPVVCTEVGGACEAIRHGIDGFVIQPDDHLSIANHVVALLKGRVKLGSTNERRQRLEAEFGVLGMVRQYEKLYASLSTTQ